MNKTKNRDYITFFLQIVLFCTVSCERPEIEPEQPVSPEEVSETAPADRFVGTWVRYWDSYYKDTLRFSKEGIFVYSLGDYPSNGSIYTDEYYYESSDNFLFYYKDPFGHGHDTHYVKFYDGDTAFTLYNFTLYPGFEPAVIYNVTYKKID